MKKGFINILLYLFIPSILTVMFKGYISNDVTYFIFSIIPYLVMILYYVIIYKDELINSIKNFKIKNIFWLVCIWIIGFLLMMGVNYIINNIIIPNGISNNEALNRELLMDHKITYSIILCLLIPFLEEISFRLEFKKRIKNKYLFIFVSAFLFSLIHIVVINSWLDLIHVIPYFILGCTFSSIYVKTDNIVYNTLAHMLHNLVCVICILFL